MDSARAWLDDANALGKTSKPDYNALGNADNIAMNAINHLRAIQSSLPKDQIDDLISVPVEDFKVLNALLKLVAIFGAYATLKDSQTLPFRNRIGTWDLPPKTSGHTPTLQQLSTSITQILAKGDDVSKLLLLSPHLIDIFALTSNYPHDFAILTSLMPTQALYKLLVQLRSVPEPSPLVIKALDTMIVQRSDAVRSMLELMVGSDKIDSADIDKATRVFCSVPPGMSPKMYIDCLGQQLYAMLSVHVSSAQQLVLATALLVGRIDQVQPKLLGKLRNLVIEPFITTQGNFANSAGTIVNLIDGLDSECGFVNHILSKIVVSIWSLQCAIATLGGLDPDIVMLICRCLDYEPELICSMAVSLMIEKLGDNLLWEFKPVPRESVPVGKTDSEKPKSAIETATTIKLISAHKPHLIEVIGARHTNEESSGILGLMNQRVSYLVDLVRRTKDETTTKIVICLLRSYMTEQNSNSPLSKLLIARAIEALTQSEDIKKKLFSDSEELVEFTFSIVAAKAAQIGAHPRKATQLNERIQDLSMADSDDEDEEEEEENGNGNNTIEDEDLLEIALSLLGSALMSILGESENELDYSDRIPDLQKLGNSDQLSKRVRSRAQFCEELLSGVQHMTEVDMSNKDSVLAAAKEALREPLAPSRAYGIHLISNLVKEDAINLKEAFSVYGSELGDEDSYVYLNAIKGIEEAAKYRGAPAVIDLLIPLIKSTRDEKYLDRSLRAREALVRLLTPGSVQTVSTGVLTQLIQDLKASARDNVDIRFRLSSASIIGIIIAEFPLSVPSHIQTEVADCALGILRHEKGADSEALHRSAVVLCLEIVNAVNSGAFQNVSPTVIEGMVLEVSSVMNETNDDTLQDLCKAVVDAHKLNF